MGWMEIPAMSYNKLTPDLCFFSPHFFIYFCWWVTLWSAFYCPLADLLTACFQSPVFCLNPYPGKYQISAPCTMIDMGLCLYLRGQKWWKWNTSWKLKKNTFLEALWLSVIPIELNQLFERRRHPHIYKEDGQKKGHLTFLPEPFKHLNQNQVRNHSP